MLEKRIICLKLTIESNQLLFKKRLLNYQNVTGLSIKTVLVGKLTKNGLKKKRIQILYANQ